MSQEKGILRSAINLDQVRKFQNTISWHMSCNTKGCKIDARVRRHVFTNADSILTCQTRELRRGSYNCKVQNSH